MDEYLDEAPPSCGITVLGMFLIAAIATFPLLVMVFIDLNSPLAVLVFLVCIAFATTLVMVGAWWAMKRFKKWIAYKKELQSQEEVGSPLDTDILD